MAGQKSSAQGPAVNRRGAYAKGIVRRRQILDRAIEVFAARGAEGTSLRAIGEAIGVSHAALKHYFDSREELLLEVLRTAEERSAQEDPAPPGSTPVGLMTHAARRNRTVPGLVQLYSTLVAVALEEGHQESREFFAARFARLRGVIVEHIEQGKRAGRIDAEVPAEAAAALIIAASDGLQIQWLLDPQVDITASLELLEKVLGTGHSAGAQPP